MFNKQLLPAIIQPPRKVSWEISSVVFSLHTSIVANRASYLLLLVCFSQWITSILRIETAPFISISSILVQPLLKYKSNCKVSMYKRLDTVARALYTSFHLPYYNLERLDNISILEMEKQRLWKVQCYAYGLEARDWQG